MDASADLGKQPAHRASAHGSPAMRIYRHALEAIFAMLHLDDLSRTLAVSREWSAAVRSMKSVAALLDRNGGKLLSEGEEFHPLPPMDELIGSPLLRHLAAIHIRDEEYERMAITIEHVRMLAQHAPNLASLWLSLAVTSVPVEWPKKLRSLELTLVGAHSGADINSLLTTLSALPSLQRVALSLPGEFAGVDFSILAAVSALTDLSIAVEDGPPEFTDQQVSQVRSSLGHLHKVNFDGLDRESLGRFMHPPVSAQWQSIGLVFADAFTGDLVVRLPTLTTLELMFFQDTPHADFLRELPRITTLELDCEQRPTEEERVWHIHNDPLLSSLMPCCSLTQLALRCGFDSTHLSALFANLTHLKTLRLQCSLETFRCFASGPIAHALEDLSIIQSRSNALAHSELAHLYALRRLRSLHLDGCFLAPLLEAVLDSLSPPTPLFPLLTRFAYEWLEPDSDVERTGPSFEWMQTRLTQ